MSHDFADIFTIEYNTNRMAFDTLGKTLSLLKDSPLLYEPGSDQRYSNYGYVVLVSILEKVTNKSYQTLLDDNIFSRLKLKNSYFSHNDKIENISKRYSFIYRGEK